ncbi:MAG TPA: right-handed parallel beta-helix repeat-containing protein, partial [Nannocystis sp.]
DTAPGTQAAPLCTISQALGRVSAVTPRAILVRGIAGGSYPELLAVPANSRVAILRVGATPVVLAGGGDQSLRIDAGARVYLDGLEVAGNTQGHGVRCTDAELWVDRSLVRAQVESGLAAEDCTLRLRSTVLTKNAREGLYLVGGEARVENSFISDNGDMNIADSPRGGIALAGGARIELIYSTLYGNSAFIGSGWSIDCDPDPAPETVEMRNSIAFNATGYSTFGCGGVEDVSRSAFSALTDDPNDDNIGVTTEEQSMLMIAEPDELGVYRPKPGSKLDTVALYGMGDPDLDFEGDPRPTEDPSFPGADQPP